MQKLFGIPLNDLLVALVALFLAGLALFVVSALRNRVAFRMGVRNIPRRKLQTALIVTGLMLATLLVSSALSTGDTLSHSIKVLTVRNLGQVDVLVRSSERDPLGRFRYFDQGLFEKVRRGLADLPVVEGVEPVVVEPLPVLAPETGLNEPRVDALGLDPAYVGAFDPPEDAEGRPIPLDGLAEDEVLISRALAERLQVSVGDRVQVFPGPRPVSLRVAGVYVRGGVPADQVSLALPLERMQSLLGRQGRINRIAVTAVGDPVQGAEHTDAVLEALRPLLEGTDLRAVPVKADALAEAEEAGNQVTSIFLIFGQFSIAAGALLIFLIFVMLATERKRELGIARAVGMQRGHLVRMFSYEGAVYALGASAVGSLLGVVVGWGMVRIMAVILGQLDFRLIFSFNWRSLVVSFTLGMVLTYAIVLVASWRVSRLNIVSAIRDLPEPDSGGRSRREMLLALGALALAVLAMVGGVRAGQASLFHLGVSVALVSLPLLARRTGLPSRLAFTVAGALLLAWWLYLGDLAISYLPPMKQGLEMWFISGLALVLGAVWVVIFNAREVVRLMLLPLGRFRGSAPVLLTAVAYPLSYRFRTGMALAMFAIVVFALMTAAFITESIHASFRDTERVSGGFHIMAVPGGLSPLPDLKGAVERVDPSTAEDMQVVAPVVRPRGLKVRQRDTEKEPVGVSIALIDSRYARQVTYALPIRASGFSGDAEVWRAVAEDPGLAIVSPLLVPSRTQGFGPQQGSFQLEGFYLEDRRLPEVYLEVTAPDTGKTVLLRVVGVLQDGAFYSPGRIITSESSLKALGTSLPPPAYFMVRLREGADPHRVARVLERGLVSYGLQALVLEDEIRRQSVANQMFSNILQGFMGLGLVVGIASLGVISARSVVERRQHIGILRALGFQRRAVQAVFLLEASIVALLGAVMGLALAGGLSPQIIGEIGSSVPGLTLRVPVLTIAVVFTLVYVATVLTTLVPAYQASRVYPAEALRFAE